jgi:hypothetical protein
LYLSAALVPSYALRREIGPDRDWICMLATAVVSQYETDNVRFPFRGATPTCAGSAVWTNARPVSGAARSETLHPVAVALTQSAALLQIGAASAAVVALTTAPASARIATADGERCLWRNWLWHMCRRRTRGSSRDGGRHAVRVHGRRDTPGRRGLGLWCRRNRSLRQLVRLAFRQLDRSAGGECKEKKQRSVNLIRFHL